MMSNNTITNKINIDLFRENEAQGLITCRKHPTHDLLIWNYTQHCQFERAWNEVTMQARGLITALDGTVVARPMRKFFNLEEYQGTIPVTHLRPFKVTEKMDGSLGIMYFIDNEPYIATRGSFTSKQAIRGTKILYDKYSGFIPFLRQTSYYTYLLEIVFKENRIVVDYGDMEDLVLLAVIDTETGEEHDIHNPAIVNMWPFPVAKHYDGIKDINELKKLEEPNKEGFVIRFESGLRLKCKFSDYVRLHRILTQCTARTIWDLLRNNQSFDDLLEKVPDEFFNWVKTTKNTLQTQYDNIEISCAKVFMQVKDLPTRKEQAAIVCKHPHSAVVFSMLDGKPYADIIWKQLKPQADRPFKEDTEV